LASFRVLGNQLCVALDGTTYFSSKAIHCHNGLRRQLSTGHTLLSSCEHPGNCVPWPSPSHCLAAGVQQAARWA
jgi:hypothetical protein